MKVNGAWYLDDDTKIVIEKADGTFGAFFMAPVKEITESDLLPYDGPDPRDGEAVPIYMYRFYGLDLNMLTPSDYARLWNMTEGRVRVLCRQGRIKGAVRIGRGWQIPPGVKCPTYRVGRPRPTGSRKIEGA